MSEHASYLYLVEIIGIGVKVGISRKPLERIAAHARDASAYGRKIGRTWISSIAHVNARGNESRIKGGSDREYLSRTFEDCLKQAQSLPMVEAPEPTSPSDLPINRFLASLQPRFGEWLKRQEAQ